MVKVKSAPVVYSKLVFKFWRKCLKSTPDSVKMKIMTKARLCGPNNSKMRSENTLVLFVENISVSLNFDKYARHC